MAASSSPGLNGRPRRLASPFEQQEPQPVQSHRSSPMLALKAGSALSNPADEVADTARQNVRFGAAHLTSSATSIGARNGGSGASGHGLPSTLRDQTAVFEPLLPHASAKRASAFCEHMLGPRTCAHGSGGQCCLRLLPGKTRDGASGWGAYGRKYFPSQPTGQASSRAANVLAAGHI
jgi:hypothetical protein